MYRYLEMKFISINGCCFWGYFAHKENTEARCSLVAAANEAERKPFTVKGAGE